MKNIQEYYMNYEIFIFKMFALFPKVFAALIGAVFSLVLAGDIDDDGKITITPAILIKFTFAISLAFYGGEAFIEHYALYDKSTVYQGAILLIFAVFGMLIVGIIYQALAMYQGKSFAEIIKDLKTAFFNVFGGK